MRVTSRNRTAPVTLLLWAALLLSGQTLALAHQHIEEAPGTSCSVCTLAKAETAACHSAAPQAPAPVARWLPKPGRMPASLPAASRHFHPRGPPRG